MSYAAKTLLILLALAAGLALFSWRVDAYRGFSLQDITTRSQLIFFLRTPKPYQMRLAEAEHLVLGSSRIAKLPAHPGTDDDIRAYNAALPGMTPTEMLAHLGHAQAIQPLKRVVIGLDFAAFLDVHPSTRFGFEPDRLLNPAHATLTASQLWQNIRDRHRMLLSGAALTENLHLALGTQPEQFRMFADGTWTMLVDAVRIPRPEKFFRIGKQYFKLAADSNTTQDLSVYRELLRFCYLHDIQAHLFISPVHYLTLVSYEEAGMLDQFFDWQASIVRATEEEAKRAARTVYPVLGLQSLGKSDEAIAAVPDVRDFIDGVHYSFAMGRRINDVVFDPEASRQLALDSARLPAYRNAVLAQYRNYRAEQPELIARYIKRIRGGVGAPVAPAQVMRR